MAKKTKKRAPKELTRKQLSRLERDKRMERILRWSVIAVTVVVVGVLAYGLIVERVIKARQSVATVNEIPITTAEFQARVRFRRMQMSSELQYLFQQQQALDPDLRRKPGLAFSEQRDDLLSQLSQRRENSPAHLSPDRRGGLCVG